MKEACRSPTSWCEWMTIVAEKWGYGASLCSSCFLLWVFEVSYNKKVKKGGKRINEGKT